MANTIEIKAKPNGDEELFQPFDSSPPDAETCLEHVYAAFADWPINWDFCPTCFNAELTQLMRDHSDVRTAPQQAYHTILHEHPVCYGGRTTFLHWLPRAIELNFYDAHVFPEFGSMLARFGCLAWSEEQLKPLRQLLSLSAVNWFTKGDTAPLQRLSVRPWTMEDYEVGQIVLGALCNIRVDPRSIAEWLLKIDTVFVWETVLEILRTNEVYHQASYFILPDERWEPEFAEAHVAIERRLIAELSDVFSDRVLLEKWVRTFEGNPELAEKISAAEWVRRTHDIAQSADERMACEAAIRRAVSRQVLP